MGVLISNILTDVRISLVVCCEQMARAYFKGGFSVSCLLLLAKRLFPNLLISCPIFTGQILFSPVYRFQYSLHINSDLNVNLLDTGDLVTSAQLFMHKNA